MEAYAILEPEQKVSWSIIEILDSFAAPKLTIEKSLILCFIPVNYDVYINYL